MRNKNPWLGGSLVPSQIAGPFDQEDEATHHEKPEPLPGQMLTPAVHEKGCLHRVAMRAVPPPMAQKTAVPTRMISRPRRVDARRRDPQPKSLIGPCEHRPTNSPDRDSAVMVVLLG